MVGQGSRQGVHRIGAAVGEDGVRFTRLDSGDGLMSGRVPEVVFHRDTFYLYVVLRPRDLGLPDPPPDATWGQYHLFVSQDGVHFRPVHEEPVPQLGPTGDWDSHNISTLRIVEEEGRFYMFYCASDRTNDWLQNVGVARSMDLIHWEKSPMNPIFGRCVDDDLGSCWYPTSLRVGSKRNFIYEYAGRPVAEPETAYGIGPDGAKGPRHVPRFVKGLSVLEEALLGEYFPTPSAATR
jgi:hypothetical protein